MDYDAWAPLDLTENKREKLLRGLLARDANHWQQDHTSPHDQMSLL